MGCYYDLKSLNLELAINGKLRKHLPQPGITIVPKKCKLSLSVFTLLFNRLPRAVDRQAARRALLAQRDVARATARARHGCPHA